MTFFLAIAKNNSCNGSWDIAVGCCGTLCGYGARRRLGASTQTWRSNADLALQRRLGASRQTWRFNADLALQRRLGASTQTWRFNADLALQRRLGASTQTWRFNADLALKRRLGASTQTFIQLNVIDSLINLITSFRIIIKCQCVSLLDSISPPSEILFCVFGSCARMTKYIVFGPKYRENPSRVNLSEV